MSAVKYLGTTDEVTTCDCCGRSNLKNTVALSLDDGDPVYYGVTCAARALKTSTKEVRAGAKAADDASAQAARDKLRGAQEASTARWFAWLERTAPAGRDPFTRIEALGGYIAAHARYEAEMDRQENPARARLVNPVCDPEQVTTNLAKMKETVHLLSAWERTLNEPAYRAASLGPAERETVQGALSAAAHAYRVFSLMQASVLMQGILQQYQLPVGLGRRIEAASRFYMRRRAPRARTMVSLKQLLKAFRVHYEAAAEAVRVGTPHDHCAVSSDREVKAGRFRLINTGNFDRATMAAVKKVVEEASARLEAKGLGAVLYGDISISNTISKSKVLAFYYPEFDDMFVRANVKGLETKAVGTVIHELAHRYDHVVLKDNPALMRLRSEIEDEEDDALAAQPRPKLGDRVPGRDPGSAWEVVALKASRVVLKPVIGGVVSTWNKPVTLALDHYWKIAAPQPKVVERGFVSEYARRAKAHPAEENFAEMVRVYCLDELSPHHVAMLRKILPAPPVASPAVPKAKAPAPRLGELPPDPRQGRPAQPSAHAIAKLMIAAYGRDEAESRAIDLALKQRTPLSLEIVAAIRGAS